jgi:hypothetical protein
MQRVKMHMSGIAVPKLGSYQDKVFREYLTKDSEKETKKTQLLALLVSNSVTFHEEAAGREWSARVRKIWNEYVGLEYGVEIPEQSNKEMLMMDYYQKTVKKMKPRLSSSKNGGLTVSGLDALKD